jgi:hypothetical protein
MTTRDIVGLERNHALIDVQNESVLYGEEMTVYVREESQVARDKYGSIKKRSTAGGGITMQAYPLTFNPNQYQIQKSGLKEEVDAIAYTPMKTWTDNSIGFEDIDLSRSSVILRGIKYWIKDKTYSGQFADTFLYITIGLRRA